MVSPPIVVILIVAAAEGALAPAPSGMRCYECSDVSNFLTCTRITTCDPNEQCFTNKYQESSGAVKYELGCAPNEKCQRLMGPRSMSDLDPGQPAKRESYSLCQDCCKGDYCNINGCSSTHATEPLRCLSCGDISDPSLCTEVAVCDDSQSCFVHEEFNGIASTYNVKCQSQQFCTMLEEEDKAIGKRAHTFCSKCCNTSHCNAKLCSPLYNSSSQPEPMKVVTFPVDVTVNGTGKKARFMCQVTGQGEYRWYFLGLNGTNRTLTGQSNAQGKNEVTVTNVTSADAGRYVCSVTRDSQTLELTAVLNVSQQPTKPVITTLPKDTSVAVGTLVTFTCAATGFPEPQIQWGHFDMFGFPEAAGVMPDVTFSANTMTIGSVSSTHEGTYVCRASNNVGSASGKFSLSVR